MTPEKTTDLCWCKHCKTEFVIEFDKHLTGDALIICPGCGWKHPRQFEGGIAISCWPPTGPYVELHKQTDPLASPAPIP